MAPQKHEQIGEAIDTAVSELLEAIDLRRVDEDRLRGGYRVPGEEEFA